MLLDGSVIELTYSGSFFGDNIMRIGPLNKSINDASWQSANTGALTRSIMPLAPEQLRVKANASGLLFHWVRSGRINADDWDMSDIPPGETNEAYTVKIVSNNGTTLRTANVVTPEFAYLTSQRLADLGSAPAGFKFKVKQNGALPGLGLEVELQIV